MHFGCGVLGGLLLVMFMQKLFCKELVGEENF